MKRLLRANPVQAFIAGLAALYIRLVYATSRWRVIGADGAKLVTGGDDAPFIGCFWHGRMLMWPGLWTRPKPITMLVSDHRDGRLIGRTIAHFGIGSLSGSSSRRGAMAMRGMAQALARGISVVVTPDGPRGPRMRAAPGVAMVAKLTGTPILPVSYSSSRAIAWSSWDRFLLALPFGRGVFIVGDPVYVARDADAAALESARRAVEAQLNRLTLEADRLCGRTPVEPAADPQRLAAGSA
jgi:lysophospholipid acyltransferase (LPLAT)-like uncharacterized protein